MGLLGKIKFVILCLKNKTSIKKGCLNARTLVTVEKNAIFKFENNFHVGSDTIINVRKNAMLEIGQNFDCNRNLYIACRKKIKIGNNVTIGPNCVIIDNNHDFKSNDYKNNYICKDIVIEDNVWIGANCIILPGTSIGENSVIGANSVIKGKISQNVVAFNKKEIIQNEYKKDK